MHNKLEELKNKKFDIKHMLGSFLGGALIAFLVVSGVNGTMSQGYLRAGNTVTSLNPAALESAKNIPAVTGACKVTNCDINAKLDLILNQVTIKTNKDTKLTFAQYVVDQFTNTNNRSSYIADQLAIHMTNSDSKLTEILSNSSGSGVNVGTLLQAYLTSVHSKLDLIKTKVDGIEGYFFPGVFTNMVNKLDLINADTLETRQYFMPGIFTNILSKLDSLLAK